MSPQSAGLAKKMGYSNIKVFVGGEPAWSKAGHLLVASDKFVNTGNIILVDLRDPAEVAKGHIPRAVNIPFDEFEDAEDEFPSRKTAPIVLYGEPSQVKQAAKMLKEWGYKKVSTVDGGLAGYTARRNMLAKGPADDEIKWVRKLGKNEVSVAEFKKALNSPGSAVILDVRTKDEAAAGRFPGAVHIPLDELEKRMAELPRDKEIFIHCSTGARAEMACQTLLKSGLKARFLVAEVESEGGRCEIVDE